MDFAKNRNAFYQDEIKSVHWSKKQITMHPIITYYRNPGNNDDLVKESLVFLSDDTCHDFHAVQHFLDIANKHLLSKEIPIDKEIIFSDGCSSQYKGRGTFADLSLSQIKEIERHFYGSEHGKGDGEIGVLNAAVDRAITGRQVIVQEARDLYDWMVPKLAIDDPPFIRKIFYVSRDAIQRNRPETEVKTLKGSRKMHDFKRYHNTSYWYNDFHASVTIV